MEPRIRKFLDKIERDFDRYTAKILHDVKALNSEVSSVYARVRAAQRAVETIASAVAARDVDTVYVVLTDELQPAVQYLVEQKYDPAIVKPAQKLLPWLYKLRSSLRSWVSLSTPKQEKAMFRETIATLLRVGRNDLANVMVALEHVSRSRETVMKRRAKETTVVGMGEWSSLTVKNILAALRIKKVASTVLDAVNKLAAGRGIGKRELDHALAPFVDTPLAKDAKRVLDTFKLYEGMMLGPDVSPMRLEVAMRQQVISSLIQAERYDLANLLAYTVMGKDVQAPLVSKTGTMLRTQLGDLPDFANFTDDDWIHFGNHVKKYADTRVVFTGALGTLLAFAFKKKKALPMTRDFGERWVPKQSYVMKMQYGSRYLDWLEDAGVLEKTSLPAKQALKANHTKRDEGIAADNPKQPIDVYVAGEVLPGIVMLLKKYGANLTIAKTASVFGAVGLSAIVDLSNGKHLFFNSDRNPEVATMTKDELKALAIEHAKKQGWPPKGVIHFFKEPKGNRIGEEKL